MAASLRELREYIDDTKVWLEKVDAETIEDRVTLPSDAPGPLTPSLQVLAPQGYMRWETSLDSGIYTLVRLGRMHEFLASRPDLSRDSAPSVAALRLEFISALRVGDWSQADACIDEIDRWNLDHAPGTLQMRIRLFEARGATEELFRFVCSNEAWNFATPRRIAAAIVCAVDVCAIQPVEFQDGLPAAYELFHRVWYPKLVQCIYDARGEPNATRMLAFAAAIDGDHRSLAPLLTHLPTGVAEFLQDVLPPQQVVETSPAPVTIPEAPHPASGKNSEPAVLTPAPAVSSPADAGAYWAALLAAVKECRAIQARTLIASLDSDLFDDPNFLSAAPDALLELLSDPDVEQLAGPRALRYEVVAALVDAFVMAEGFPRLEHLEIYLSLLDGLVALKASVTSDADSQLVLGLVGATSNLSADACPRCEQIVRLWWRTRPVIQRLDWLGAALDSLGPLHADPHQLLDLYTDGLTLAARKGLAFAPTKAAVWWNIGRMLELPAADIEQLLNPLAPEGSGPVRDPLADAGLRQIAVVSLREASAYDAAQQLEARTGAKVSVVSSLTAGSETRNALTADLILYVWAATTHATYRAFDDHRHKIEYVQGTGSSSIIMAAERWAARVSDQDQVRGALRIS
ncbi:hypothetical protein [Ramlibacter alkalitolerans]|uniref:Uncharacterized protein n=1 Tax=Ramlibacter alkalitolerans TaxID=2039631 RepID=A0ABS1JVT6_9BURK|nr:hypothetical protein [Ramlibacter alkalitolerans]MBL0427966.1 hypothetical protein [Ramlibacter alkalitolerans]